MSKQMRKSRKAVAWIVMIAMMITLFPTAVFGAGGVDSTVQIDGQGSPLYYELNETGEIIGEGHSSPLVRPEGDDSDRVVLSKTISGTSNENEFKIDLTVSTTEDLENLSVSPDAAVVLVMDVSNSMEWYLDGRKNWWNDKEIIAPKDEQRLTKAKAAAAEFVNGYVKDAGNAKRMISVVQYGSNAQTVSGWHDAVTHKETILNDIEKKVAIGFALSQSDQKKNQDSGGTNIEGGLMLANNLLAQLESTPAYRDIKNLHVILLTDGVPTYHVADSSSSTTYIAGSRGGGSYASRDDYKDVPTLAGAIKGPGNGRAVLSTIAFSTDTDKEVGSYKNAALWLESFASQGCAYAASESDKLAEVFTSINETIKKLAEAWQVVDPLGDYMYYAGGLSTDASDVKYYDSQDNTIHWNLRNDTTFEKTTSGQKTTYTYRASYLVRLDNTQQGFLYSVKNSKEAADHTYYPTNKKTTLTYVLKDIQNGQETISDVKTADFLIPRVEGYADDFTFAKVAYENNQKPLENAHFRLDAANNYFLTAVSGADGTVTFKDVPSGHSYVLTETQAPQGYVVDPALKYQVDVVMDKAEGKDMPKRTITNRLDPQTKVITIHKQWVGPAGTTYPEASLTLLQNGEALTITPEMVLASQQASLTKEGTIAIGGSANDAEWVTLKVPKLDVESGQEYVYTVQETCAGYDLTTDYSSDKLSLVNTISQSQKSITVNKNWVNPTGSYGEPITIELYKTGEAQPIQTQVLAAGQSSVTFDNLDVYDANGQYISYTVKDSVPGYNEATAIAQEISGGTANETITLNNVLDQQKITISGEKIWLDAAAKDSRPASIQVQLLADGEAVAEADVWADESGRWPYTFADLPKYQMTKDENGKTTSVKEIDYAIVEVGETDGVITYQDQTYSVTYSSDGSVMNITNRLIGTTELNGMKVWEDYDNQYETRPETLIVTLSNGDTTTVDASGSFQFTDLPKYDALGQQIVYTVTDSVPGYTAKAIYDGANVTLTNTLVNYGETTSLSGQKVWPMAATKQACGRSKSPLICTPTANTFSPWTLPPPMPMLKTPMSGISPLAICRNTATKPSPSRPKMTSSLPWRPMTKSQARHPATTTNPPAVLTAPQPAAMINPPAVLTAPQPAAMTKPPAALTAPQPAVMTKPSAVLTAPPLAAMTKPPAVPTAPRPAAMMPTRTWATTHRLFLQRNLVKPLW